MTREEAIKAAEGAKAQVIMRSCWNCNGAHEHLKQADYVVWCVAGCDNYYYKGVKLNADTEAPDECPPT
jgi:hypothetical protein